MNFTLSPLAVALRIALGTSLAGAPGALLAAGNPSGADIPEIRVTAVAITEDPDRIATPFSVLDADRLFARGGATLGDALGGLPGVHSDTFGGGASRPVVRGQSAPRIAALSNGATIFDASGVSPDHAITAEPLLARQVEVLRGPSALLYGGGAIGGVVNVVDRRIPDRLPDAPVEGFFALRADRVADEVAGAFSLTGRATDNVAVHLEGLRRRSEDYRVSGWEASRVPGSFAESDNLSGGVSWIGSEGYLGLAYSYRHDEYGLPGHSHEYESCHPHGSALHCGDHDHDDGHDHDHEHANGHEEAPWVDLVSRRIDLRGELNDPFPGFERLQVHASHTDYRHHEIDDGEIATTFTNKGHEARIELQHRAIGDWHGLLGLQYADTEFAARGTEAFVPTTETRRTQLFLVEHFQPSDAWHFEAGIHHERQRLRPVSDPRGRPSFNKSATSIAGAAIWNFTPGYALSLSLDRAERLPQAQEMYARGIHLATNTYECGLVPHPLTCGGAENNAPIRKETSRNVDLTLRGSEGDLSFSISAFHNIVDDYIYARTLDRHEDFRLVKYTQQDARFTGFEGEVHYQFTANLSGTVFGDLVRGRLRSGGDLPRIPAARIGARVHTQLRALHGELEYYHVRSQDDIADFEETTPSHDMLNLTVSYRMPSDERYSVFLRGGNLLNETVWNHASFLAGTVPLPGRNLSAGVRIAF